MNMDYIPAIFKYVFKSLGIDPKEYWVSEHKWYNYLSHRLTIGERLYYFIAIKHRIVNDKCISSIFIV